MPTINLPSCDGRLTPYRLSGSGPYQVCRTGKFNRIAFAAAHVVADPLGDQDPWLDSKIDWNATLAYRHYLWDLGLGVAEAMDTAQRGMGLGWPTSLELIRRSVAAAKDAPDALIFCGAGTDHLQPGEAGLAQVVDAYEQQIGEVEKVGGRVIIMASRALAAAARGPEEYVEVYDRILRQIREKAIIHWLGEMFDPALAGYWGHRDIAPAIEVVLDVIRRHAAKIDGIKISLLDKHHEIAMRRRLPNGVRMYTGDDFNYAELIAGDEHGHSDALLGIFDAIAPAAAAALSALSEHRVARFREILEPTLPLSRHIFQEPTRFYKTGIVFMAYLNGHQNHFVMVGGQERARSIVHLAELFRLADKAGLLADPEIAAHRMAAVLRTHGID
jgi:hypothetical protein